MNGTTQHRNDTKRQLPTGWRWGTLGDVCEITARQVDPKLPEFSGLPHVSAEDMESGTGRLLPLRSAAEDGMISGKYVFEPGCVLYSKIRPYLRKVAIAPSRGLCSADIYPLQVLGHSVDSRFLVWLLLSQPFTEYATSESRRARMPKLNREQLFSYIAPLPPLAEQRRIAAILDAQMVEADRARAAVKAQLDAAVGLPAACLRQVFPRASDELPGGWRLARLADLGDSTRGDAVQTGPFGAQLSSSEFVEEGVPVLNIGNVQWGALDCTRMDHVTEDKAVSLDRYRVRQGDLLFTRSGTVGRSTVVPAWADGWLISYHLLRVALSPQLAYPEFVAAAIRGCPAVVDQVRLAAGRGATRDGVNTTILADLRIPLPPLAEQRRIAVEVSDRMAVVAKLRARLKAQLAEIEVLPAALLRRAFNGEL